jgi:hypothetical protein
LLVLIWGISIQLFAASLPKKNYSDEAVSNSSNDPLLKRIVDIEGDYTNATYWTDNGAYYTYTGSQGPLQVNDTLAISGVNTYALYATGDAQTLGNSLGVTLAEFYDIPGGSYLGGHVFAETTDVPLGDSLLPLLLLLTLYSSYKLKKRKGN